MTDPGNAIVGKLEPLRDGWILNGWVAASVDCKLLPLTVVIDGVEVAVATAVYGLEPGRLSFEFPIKWPWQDGRQHEIAVHLPNGGPAIGHLNDVITQQRRYRDPDALLAWAFHHRIVAAPFNEVDRIFLAYFDHEAELLNAMQMPPGEAPLVSVIMPCLNAASIVGAAIASVQTQTFTNWELLIVDDGSTDETDTVIASFDDRRINSIRLSASAGLGFARNAALAQAHGHFVAHLDADNYWDPRFLAVMIQRLLERPDLDAAFCSQYLLRPGESLPCALRTGGFNPALIANDNQIDINCLFHRREAAVAIGGFDPLFHWLEDWDLVLRLSAEKPLLFVPAALSYYRLGSANEEREKRHQASWELMAARRDSTPGAFCSLASPSRAVIFPPPAAATRAPTQGVTIVIPSFEVPDSQALCVVSLFATIVPAAIEVILCDNGSSRTTLERIAALQQAHPTLRIELLDQNYGFTTAVNHGIALARSGNHVVLLNNDAIVTPGWLEALVEFADQPEVGAVVPRQILLPGTPSIIAHAPMANQHLEIDVNLSAHHANVLTAVPPRADGAIELNFAPFFCVLLTSRALAKLGPLDVRRGRHNRSDRLYCLAMRNLAELRILYTPLSKVYHLLMQSTFALHAARPDEHRLIFVEDRWKDEIDPWDA